MPFYVSADGSVLIKAKQMTAASMCQYFRPYPLPSAWRGTAVRWPFVLRIKLFVLLVTWHILMLSRSAMAVGWNCFTVWKYFHVVRIPRVYAICLTACLLHPQENRWLQSIILSLSHPRDGFLTKPHSDTAKPLASSPSSETGKEPEFDKLLAWFVLHNFYSTPDG
jgi:hypothetical protein